LEAGWRRLEAIRREFRFGLDFEEWRGYWIKWGRATGGRLVDSGRFLGKKKRSWLDMRMIYGCRYRWL
jgi:hypothetical protein